MENTIILIWSVPFLILLSSLYWYLKKKVSYWKDLGVPYLPAQYFFELFLKPAQDVEVDRYKKYGRLFGLYEGVRPTLTVADPELLKNILIKDFQFFTSRRNLEIGDPILDSMVSVLQGEDWKRVRTIITPAFTTGKIRKMTSVILDAAKTLSENFDKCFKAGEPINAKRFYGAFTMDVIASTAFATKIDSHNDPENKFVSMAKLVFSRNVPIRFIFFILFPAIFKLFRIPVFAPKSLKFFKEVTLQIIEERRKTGQVRNDFLQILMDATNEPKNSTAKGEAEEIEDENEIDYKIAPDQKGLSRDELVAQCVIFFLAGYDTTASTLSFVSYLLALNPDCQEKLLSEIDKVLANNKGELTYEAVQSMKYLDNVISETLRLFPPAIRLERQTDQDYELGNTGIVITKQMIVGIPVYAMHHDSEFYPDPEKFDPDRFTTEAKEQRNPYTYLPFGAGPRNCLGMRFALMEIKICLAYIFSQFRVKVCPQTKIPLEYFVGQGLLQPKEIMLDIERRSKKA